MYCLGDQRTYDFLARVLAFFPPFTEKSVSVAGCALGGFDHSLYGFLHHPSNFDYSRSVRSRQSSHSRAPTRCASSTSAPSVTRLDVA